MLKCNKFIYNKSNLNEMEFFMKSLKGILFIIASFALTILTWMNSSPQFMIPGLALTSLSLTFILATRLPLLESWFHGLEKVYTVHKFTAFLSIILLIFHNFSMGGLWGSRLAAQFGIFPSISLSVSSLSPI